MDKSTRANKKALIRSLAHIGLQTADIEQSRLFYVDTLELDVVEESETDFTLDLGCGALLQVSAGGKPGQNVTASPNRFCLNFKVRDFDRACRALANAGVSFVEDRREIFPGVWFASFLDPDGNRIEIMTPLE